VSTWKHRHGRWFDFWRTWTLAGYIKWLAATWTLDAYNRVLFARFFWPPPILEALDEHRWREHPSPYRG